MKDFTVNKSEKEKYIKDVRKVKKLSGQECYEITYADGRKFKNIMCHEDNLAKIESAQEEQASKAFANQDVFKNKAKKYKFSTLTGVVATSIVGATPLGMVINGTIINNNSQMLPLSVGTIFAGATVFSFFKYLSNKGKIAQLEKIDYINKNKDELSALKNYENALTGLSRVKKDYFKNTKKPFSILEIEKYSKKDLEIIISNIKREEKYHFEYNKKKVKSKENESRSK